MAASRRITADLHRVEALQHPSVCGVALSFLPTSRNAREIDTVDVFAPLGPEHTLESADGVSTVVRVARAARVAVPPGTTDSRGTEPASACRVCGAAHRCSSRSPLA